MENFRKIDELDSPHFTPKSSSKEAHSNEQITSIKRPNYASQEVSPRFTPESTQQLQQLQQKSDLRCISPLRSAKEGLQINTNTLETQEMDYTLTKRTDQFDYSPRHELS